MNYVIGRSITCTPPSLVDLEVVVAIHDQCSALEHKSKAVRFLPLYQQHASSHVAFVALQLNTRRNAIAKEMKAKLSPEYLSSPTPRLAARVHKK
jgi:hypothetical protein